MIPRNILAVVLITTFMFASGAYAGKAELTTYYPAPYGEYKNLSSTEGANFATTSGSVGIGMTGPGEKLEVNGNVKAAAFFATVGAAGGPFRYSTTLNVTVPDYVFASGYKLMPLNELRDYVFTNKHLPGVLSSEELQKAGSASLVEQNFKNLEKIEELVLYTLQLKSEADALKAENARLEARVTAIEGKLGSGE